MTRNISLGVSSYSFHQRLSSGDMDLLDVIEWVAQSGAEHLELAVLSDDPDSPIPNLASDPAFVERVRAAAESAGVVLSNLAVGNAFWSTEPVDVAAAVSRVEAYVDLASSLGISKMRHDVVGHENHPGDDTPLFEAAFPAIVAGSKQVARYAATKGVTTSLENHGFFVQSADRVRRIVHAVDEPNFKTTLDVGNFVCVDEDPAAVVAENLPYAMVVHLKDFYVRDIAPGDGWFRSRGGKYLRGAIVGNGDLDLVSVARSIVESGYEGYAAIEFEGIEDCLLGIERGLANARRLLALA
ncbi:sugar phosphate isomerase/epimerase [Humibacter sp. RRB41]|uniref:sugar phosphate isomerase/epimerase family protein n=1 Tax=Humibacter sp. RRB41 TaxID=2919946 RepID=UPI001FAA576B|nr:sugar phosphate isomerase/epimerase family protein [Humibacter sp. RRB41]